MSGASDSGGWSQSFAYDTYGNLWQPSTSGVGLPGGIAQSNVFNGNNQMASLGGGTAQYLYDGLGQRVGKVMNSTSQTVRVARHDYLHGERRSLLSTSTSFARRT